MSWKAWTDDLEENRRMMEDAVGPAPGHAGTGTGVGLTDEWRPLEAGEILPGGEIRVNLRAPIHQVPLSAGVPTSEEGH